MMFTTAMKSHTLSWIAGSVMALATLIVAIPGPSLASTESLAAVFPPWWPQARVIQAAARAGNLMDAGAWPSVAVLEFTDEGLPGRLRATGAWLVLDAASIGCASATD